MKKLLSAIAVTSMLLGSTAAVAHDNYRHGYRGYEHRYEHRRHDHRRDRGVNTGEAVAIGLGALILGAAIANSNRERRERVQVCEDVVKYDHYGNQYYERRCYLR